jgi:hypothetical protein
MAKHVILESYSFNNSTRTVTVTGKNIRREQLLLITNVTAGTVIYNFSDPSLGFTSYTNSVDSTTGLETTIIILTYNTSSMGSSDKLSILVEEIYQEITPSETLRDPVDKLRVSTPQSLIDTDFEYGTQPTKWDSINLLNNRPSGSFDPTQGISNTSRSDLAFVGANTSAYQITNVTSSARVVTVAIGNTAGITVGLPIYISGTADNANVDGWWIIESVSTNVNFTFTVINTPSTSALYDAFKTYVFIGAWYTGAAIPTTGISMSGTVGTVTTTGDHGLRVGDGINIVGTTGTSGYATGAGTINSSWTVATTPTNNTFTFAAASGSGVQTATLSGGANATLYPRALGFIQHRPFDGGVQFSNETPYHGYQVIRQTRRQFRYQSGKGLQFSTGSLMKPTITTENITSSGTTVTVTTKYAHGLLPGAVVRIQGCTETAYNGTFTVVTTASATTFTYTAGSTPSASPATGNWVVNPWTWYGSSNRVGMFDSQNGFFFEFDGQTLYAVRRSSTFQLAGVAAVTNGSQSVTGTSTKFSEQLKPGDSIVIRGMTYFVQNITSDTQMYIYPEYRGVTNSLITVSKTIDTRYAQSTWNIDRCDGTGASLYNVDLTKMQMFYMDFTWYGAGAIRFGFKNNRGEVFYCHRIPNSNLNSEAYMRSGNLVARYETSTLPYRTFLTATLSNAATTGATISVADTTGWPNSGTVAIKASAATGAAIEYITYSAKTLTSLTITSRAQTGGSGAAQTFTVTGATAGNPSGTAPILVELYSPQSASTISHWGSSVIMDGRYDDDKSLVFVAGQTRTQTITNVGQDTTVPLISIRIAPTVDNGLTGILGAREIINRMQLTLRSMACQTTGSGATFLITLRLNGRVSAGTFNSVGGSSLAQVAYHTAGTTIAGGENVFGFYTNTPGVTGQDLSTVRDIGNSILGGGTSNTCPTNATNVYPDGPDILTICATNITTVTTNSVNARISWTEAQA